MSLFKKIIEKAQKAWALPQVKYPLMISFSVLAWMAFGAAYPWIKTAISVFWAGLTTYGLVKAYQYFVSLVKKLEKVVDESHDTIQKVGKKTDDLSQSVNKLLESFLKRSEEASPLIQETQKTMKFTKQTVQNANETIETFKATLESINKTTLPKVNQTLDAVTSKFDWGVARTMGDIRNYFCPQKGANSAQQSQTPRTEFKNSRKNSP